MRRSPETTKTLRMCRFGLMNASSIDAVSTPSPPGPSPARSQPRQRIHRLALMPHLEVEAGPPERAGIAHGAERLPLPHVGSFGHADLRGVTVQRVVLPAMVHDDHVAVAAEPARVHHLPGIHGVDVRALRDLDLDPVPERLGAEPGMHLSA